MNNSNTQQPSKISPLFASALLMAGLGNRYTKMYNGRTAGIPVPTMNIKNQRQKRKLKRQTA